MSFWTPILSVGGSLVVALAVSLLTRASDKGRWLREERMKIYAEYLKSSELYRIAKGQPAHGLDTMIEEIENRTKLDILGPRKVRAAATRMRLALEPIRTRKTFTEEEYGEYLHAKTALVLAQANALRIRDTRPPFMSDERIAEWWQREYNSARDKS